MNKKKSRSSSSNATEKKSTSKPKPTEQSLICALESVLETKHTSLARVISEAKAEVLLKKYQNKVNLQKLPDPKPDIAITSVEPLDVLFGRGNKQKKYAGNWLFHQIIGMNRSYYSKLHPKNKVPVARALMLYMKRFGTRFLEEVTSLGRATVYREAKVDRVVEKFCQGLREKSFSFASLIPQVRQMILECEANRRHSSRTITATKKGKEKATSTTKVVGQHSRVLPKWTIPGNEKQVPNRKCGSIIRATTKQATKNVVVKKKRKVKEALPTKTVTKLQSKTTTKMAHKRKEHEKLQLIIKCNGPKQIENKAQSTLVPLPTVITGVNDKFAKKPVQSNQLSTDIGFFSNLEDCSRYAGNTWKSYGNITVRKDSAVDDDTVNVLFLDVIRPPKFRKVEIKRVVPLPIFFEERANGVRLQCHSKGI